MPAPFDALEDLLLRGGIAPRHVKRYLRELSEHLADLTAAQAEAGFDAGDAAARARAALGPDQELADAMLKQRDFRSISARFPWAVFGILPALAAIVGVGLPVLLIFLAAEAGKHLFGLQRGFVEPHWLQLAMTAPLEAGNLLAMPLTALLLTIIAWRQRLSPFWLLLALAVMAPLVIQASIEFPATAEIARKKGAALSLGLGLSTSGAYAEFKNLLWLAAHYGLSLLPVAWLFWAQRRLAKVPFPS